MRYIHLRLTRQPDAIVHGIDLSRARVGDIVVVTTHSAVKLIAEGWAVESPASALQPARNIYPPSRAAVS
jgi:hypothetical protein